MKNNYYVVSIAYNGKAAAYVQQVPGYYNLKDAFPFSAVTISAMETKKQALETATAWNETWNHDGKLLFNWYIKYGTPVYNGLLTDRLIIDEGETLEKCLL